MRRPRTRTRPIEVGDRANAFSSQHGRRIVGEVTFVDRRSSLLIIDGVWCPLSDARLVRSTKPRENRG